jgi:hypothetical protein
MRSSRRHIKLFHTPDTQAHHCVRCHRCFQTSEELDEHLLEENVCEKRSGQDDEQRPENGLSAKKYKALTKRGKGDKVDTWDALCKFLFPDDQIVPNSRE